MKIGIFDSGLGGLFITRAIREFLPKHDLVYLGDTLHVPYGGRSKETVYQLSEAVIDYLFSVQDCALIIIACNTASACALRQLQQTYLTKNYPDRRILGVVIPTLETAIEQGHKKIGVIATENIIHSNIYEDELKKINPNLSIYGQATPLLVPMIEHDGLKWIDPILEDYLSPLLKEGIDSLILGCTHYPTLKEKIKNIVGKDITLISQDEIIPQKLADYLERHPEIDKLIDKNGLTDFLMTDITRSYIKTAQNVYRQDITPAITHI